MFTELLNLKFLLESQKVDKNIIKSVDEELNNIQTNLKRLLTIQNEWTRLEDILTAEQKWLHKTNKCILDLTKTTSKNYDQTISQTQVNEIQYVILYHKPLPVQKIHSMICYMIYF